MEAATWGAIAASCAALVAVGKFWIDLGKLYQRADDALERGNVRDARYELMAQQINEFKVDVAKTYATSSAVADVERQTARTIEQAMAGVNQRLDGLTTRMDSLITMASRRQNSE